MNDADELGELVGILGPQVMVLVDVVPEVIEERLALADHKFPIALTNADDLRRAIAHLPIQEVVLQLLAGFAEHRGAEGNAVKEKTL